MIYYKHFSHFFSKILKALSPMIKHSQFSKTDKGFTNKKKGINPKELIPFQVIHNNYFLFHHQFSAGF